MKISNKVYDTLKWVVIVAIPLIEDFIIGMGLLYGFSTEKIIGTIALTATLVGGLIGISTKQYYKKGQ